MKAQNQQQTKTSPIRHTHLIVAVVTILVISASAPAVAAVEDGANDSDCEGVVAVSGDVTVTAQPPHPDIEDIQLIDREGTDLDLTEEASVTPDEQ